MHIFSRERVRLVVALVFSGAFSACWATPAVEHAGAPAAGDVIARGKYLATAGDCVSCHTAPNGKPYAGGLYMNTPFGPISTPNITPDKATGIGAISDDAFYRVFHEGIGQHGEYLYPVMPFPWYAKVTRADVLAIKAYLFTLPPVTSPRPPSHMRFPFNIREGLAAWRAVFFNDKPLVEDPSASAEINRGAYLVNGLGHCGECHNGSKLVGDSRWGHALQGGEIDGWYAPNLTSDIHEGIGAWTSAELVEYLKTGVSQSHGVALGPMAQAVHESLGHLNEDDLKAIAAYLKAGPAKSGYTEAKYSDFQGRGAPGSQTYLNNCASCHGLHGEGVKGIAPALSGNGAVTAAGPQNVIRVILGGKEASASYAPMIAIGATMSNEDVADVANFVRQSFRNRAPPTATPGMVAALRPQTKTLLDATTLDQCPAAGSSQAARWVADPAHGIGPLLTGLTDATLIEGIDQIAQRVRSARPALGKADAVNALTGAYCPIVQGEAGLSPGQRTARLGTFSEAVYTELTASRVR